MISEAGEYQATISMTIKSWAVEGSSEVVTGKINVVVSFVGTGGTLCEGEITP